MVYNALTHLPDAIQYMSMLNNKQVFRFCAIPQIMAIATLAKLYNNSDALKGIIKIDRTLTLEIFSAVKNMNDFKHYYTKFINELLDKNTPENKHYTALHSLLNTIKW